MLRGYLHAMERERIKIRAVVENVPPNGLSFTFLKSDGTPLDTAVAGDDEGDIGIVLVELDVVVDRGIGNDGVQELTSVVDLRNRQ